MPANPKYLTTSRPQRFAKISASIAGSFLVAASMHIALASWISPRTYVWATYSFMLFIVWCALMLLPFLFKNGWKCWILYGFITVLSGIIAFMGIKII